MVKLISTIGHAFGRAVTISLIFQFACVYLYSYLNKYLFMQVVNYTEFRNNLTKSLNTVNDDGEIVIVSRSKGKNVVVMSLEEYNSMLETLYLSGTKANRQRLDESIDEMNDGKFETHNLIDQ